MGGRGKAQRLPVSLRSEPERDGCIDYAVWQRPEVVASTPRSGITPVFSGSERRCSEGCPGRLVGSSFPKRLAKLWRAGYAVSNWTWRKGSRP
jgi:hypothetical protein